MNRKYYVYEDNAGFYHLALCENGTCAYYFVGEKQRVLDSARALSNLDADEYPPTDWDGGEGNPAECIRSIEAFAAAGNGGAWLVETGEW